MGAYPPCLLCGRLYRWSRWASLCCFKGCPSWIHALPGRSIGSAWGDRECSCSCDDCRRRDLAGRSDPAPTVCCAYSGWSAWKARGSSRSCLLPHRQSVYYGSDVAHRWRAVSSLEVRYPMNKFRGLSLLLRTSRIVPWMLPNETIGCLSERKASLGGNRQHHHSRMICSTVPTK